MRRLVLYCTLAVLGHVALASTYTVTTSSNLQSVISGTAPGDTVLFSPGTYTIASGLTLNCGVTYTALTPTRPSNVILSASFSEEASDIFALNSGCSAGVVIDHLSSLHAGLLYAVSPASNIVFTNNQMGDLKCCSTQNYAPGLYFNTPGGSNTSLFTNITIKGNTFGDSTSCTSPQSPITLTTSPDTYQGNCAGIMFESSVNGVVVENNNFYHVSEGIHFLCYGNNCEPPNGYTLANITGWYNDFSTLHRIPWELQPQVTSAIDVEYNDVHDWIDPYYDTFGVSFACCDTGATSPYVKVANNVIIFNSAPVVRYGYGMEAWGAAGTYTNNLVQSGSVSTSYGMAWGYDSYSSTAPSFNNNTICGPGFSSAGYIENEGYSGQVTPTQTGNTLSSTCSTVTSYAPTISPATGAQTYPLTVSITDAGYTSGPQPLGNTSIYYTTDGSAPVPGQGTTQLYTAPFKITSAGTVKAVGMWGQPNQPLTYPSGYGFVPSAAASAVYTGGGARSVTSVVLTTGSSLTALHVGATNQAAALCKYSDGSSDNCTASGNTVTWVSSAPATATISSSGLITAVANGTTSFTAAAGGQTSAAVPLTVSTLSSITITAASTSLHTAATDQFTATCVYANGYSDGCNTVDLYGYTAGWTSGTPATGTISASGLLTAVAAGTTAVHASIGGVSSSSITVTVTAPTLSSIALATTGGVTSIAVAATNQILATCTYSDSSSGPCSPTTWNSSVTAAATISSGGVVTGVAAGSTNITASIGAVTSPNLALTITAAAATLTGGHLANPASVNTMPVGGTVQFSAVCNYSDGTSDNCTRAGGVIGWASNNPSVMSMSSLGLATGLALGSANAQAVVSGTKLNPWTMTINNTVTLTGATIQLFGGATSIPLGAMIQATVTCQYSDSSTTTCSGTADSHGNLATTYTSSSTGVATINSTGLVTPVSSGSTTFGATVGSFTPSVTVFVSAGIAFGQSSTDTTGTTSNNALKGDYVLTGSNTSGYSVASCSMFLPTGTVTSGDHIDCGITLAPTATTQASSALCHATYTQPSASAPNDWVTIPLTGCGTLSPNTAYWVWRQTDDPLTTNVGFWDCGSNCTGTAPTAPGPGNFTSYYALNTYGTYTGMTTTMSTGGAGFQQSIYATLSAAPPTLVSAYQANSGSVNQLQIYGKPIQQHAMCTYSDSVSLDCTNGDSRGSSVTAWSSAFSPVLSIGAVGSSTPGLVSPVNPGYTYTSCTVTGGIACSPWYWTVIFPPRTGFTFPGMTLSGVKVH